jgi:hypothetical protein
MKGDDFMNFKFSPTRILWAAILVAGVSAGAQAASRVPDKVGAFVAYCATHFDECNKAIMVHDTAAAAEAFFDENNNSKSCVVPKGVADDTATKMILAWLAAHMNVFGMKTDDGIHAAEKDLWHCQLQIGDGAVPGGPPAKTGAFVAYCSTHYVKCANEIVAVSASVILIQDTTEHCLAPKSMQTKDLTVAVLGWLGQHEDTYLLDTDDGIYVAIDHLWPCH